MRSSSPARSVKQSTSVVKLVFTKSSQSSNVEAKTDENMPPSQVSTSVPLRSRMRIGRAKMRKLVVGGIADDQPGRFAAVKTWCESHGRVDKIIRASNGDLHVYFDDPAVADRVCTIRKGVAIKGAGSVHLSWFTGSKPSSSV
jgi:hypothetical protein